MSRRKAVVAVVAGALLALPAAAAADTAFESAVQHARGYAATQEAATEASTPAGSFPSETDGTAWEVIPASDWRSGMLPGSEWLLYQLTGNPAWRTDALARELPIAPEKKDTTTSDLGFMLYDSFGHDYALTNDPAAKKDLLKAAASLSTRYNPIVGSFRTFNGGTGTDFKVTIDSMMNLELLLWAAAHGGPSSERDIALSHASNQLRDNLRVDGSTYQVVVYDDTTGAVKYKYSFQGYATDSTWSRGQSWAMYGCTMLYRLTGQQRFLDCARLASDWWWSHIPTDLVPYWDFEAPGIPNEPKDSSAAAVAASAYLEQARLDPDPTRRADDAARGEATLASLASSAYLSEGSGSPAVLLHGTPFKEHGRYDVGMSIGDYYFIEALLRTRFLPPSSPPLHVSATAESSHSGKNSVAKTVDGSLATRWASKGDGQWVQYDLGSQQTVHGVTVAWYQGDTKAARFDIQLSPDASSWTTVMSGVSTGQTASPETYDFTDASARYVRIVVHGTNTDLTNGISEVTVD